MTIVLTSCLFTFAQDRQEIVQRNNWGSKLRESNFHLGLDFQTKYVWRGMEMMTEDAAPVLFPSISYSCKGLYAYAMGGYAINGKYAEVDLGVCYSWNGFTFGLNDYYYPTIDSNNDEYFGGKIRSHWIEIMITYAPDKIPMWVTASSYIAGKDDRYVDSKGKDKQAFSTYIEVGTYYNFLHNNRIALSTGLSLNRGTYTNYEKEFAVCDIELKYTYNLHFKSGWTLPMSCSYIYNPHRDKSFVNFTANISF